MNDCKTNFLPLVRCIFYNHDYKLESKMKNIIISLISIFLIGCKATQVQTVTINASKDDVWSVVSSLGDLANYSALDSSSLTPPGEATVGAVHYVSQGKNYGISDVVTVEKNKTIQTKLKETSWPAHYWNESCFCIRKISFPVSFNPNP